MNYYLFHLILFIFSVSIFIFTAKVLKSGSEHPLSVTTFFITAFVGIAPFFLQETIFNFSEPICIKQIEKVKIDYSWKQQGNTFFHNKKTHSIKTIIDYRRIDINNPPDSVIAFEYVYENIWIIEPSQSFFVYSAFPTKYTTEGACITHVETK